MKTLLLSLLFASGLHAAVIAAQSGGIAGNESYGPSQYTVLSWTMPFAAENVSVSATLFTPKDSSLTAYLSRSIGPGAVAIYHSDHQYFASPTQVERTLLTGLTLDPGTYYLVLASVDQNAGALSFTNTTQTLAAGVTINGGTITMSANTSNPVASDFFPGSSFDYLFSVQGDITTPEPSSVLLTAAGIVCLVAIASRRR